jgi:cyclopropane fatty-acyl-phospholipid synthase-like methyltransferase
MSKPYSESCEQNRTPILKALAPRLADCETLLEIGSGTGQHAVYFAPNLAQLVWQTSDRVENHHGIKLWLEEAALPNVRAPLALDVLVDPWPTERFDAVFSANTAHIMSESAVAAMFSCVGEVLRTNGPFMLYGPFNYDGRFTSDSNARFDGWLRQHDPQMGIRDLAWLRELGDQVGLELDEDLEMPVNNRFLVWRKQG